MTKDKDIKEFIKNKNEQFEKEMTTVKEFKDIKRKVNLKFKRTAWTWVRQKNLPKKVFSIERLEMQDLGKDKEKLAYPSSWQAGKNQYRICCYIVSQYGKWINTWRWGQSCPIVPEDDLLVLSEALKIMKESNETGYIKTDKF